VDLLTAIVGRRAPPRRDGVMLAHQSSLPGRGEQQDHGGRSSSIATTRMNRRNYAGCKEIVQEARVKHTAREETASAKTDAISRFSFEG